MPCGPAPFLPSQVLKVTMWSIFTNKPIPQNSIISRGGGVTMWEGISYVKSCRMYYRKAQKPVLKNSPLELGSRKLTTFVFFLPSHLLLLFLL